MNSSFFIKPLRTGASALALVALCAGMADAQSTVLTKKGAEVDGKTATPISSKTSHTGDTFELPVVDLLFVHHPELKGAAIEGHLENVTPAAPTHKASMNIIFDDIKFADGNTEPISVALKNVSAFEPKTHHVRDMGIIDRLRGRRAHRFEENRPRARRRGRGLCDRLRSQIGHRDQARYHRETQAAPADHRRELKRECGARRPVMVSLPNHRRDRGCPSAGSG